MSGSRNKAIRRKFREENSRGPKATQFNILQEVVEKDEWRKYKKEMQKEFIQKGLIFSGMGAMLTSAMSQKDLIKRLAENPQYLLLQNAVSSIHQTLCVIDL